MGSTVRDARDATQHLLKAAGLSLASYFYLAVLVFAVAVTVLVLGAAVLPEAVILLRSLAGIKRRQVEAWTGVAVPVAYRQLPQPLVDRVRVAATDPATRRDLCWLAAHFLYGWLLAYAALLLWTFGVLVDGVWCGLLGRRAVVLPQIGRLADLDASWSARLLAPSAEDQRAQELAERVEELTATRAEAVAAHGAELRRIERDLHDGTQARLVALSMRVGLATKMYDEKPDMARKLLSDAQTQAEEALTELRHVVRGIHPPILTDRGLLGAIRALAAGSGLDVDVREDGVEESPRAPAAVETVAYFVVAEALTNSAKHSGGRRARVEVSRAGRALRVVVRDEGKGGADEKGGTGLLGMRRRIAALDGTIRVSSPAGGPTVIEVELPCAW
ncbi:sensor histidine kinase [Streptomyces sp. NPDC046939]|uniref:sensor histidine kinase n=1 Tax=Streptomyces sp. NPDC046939 TaxID=3155376 RepID=UPI0033C50B1A